MKDSLCYSRKRILHSTPPYSSIFTMMNLELHVISKLLFLPSKVPPVAPSNFISYFQVGKTWNLKPKTNTENFLKKDYYCLFVLLLYYCPANWSFNHCSKRRLTMVSNSSVAAKHGDVIMSWVILSQDNPDISFFSALLLSFSCTEGPCFVYGSMLPDLFAIILTRA